MSRVVLRERINKCPAEMTQPGAIVVSHFCIKADVHVVKIVGKSGRSKDRRMFKTRRGLFRVFGLSV